MADLTTTAGYLRAHGHDTRDIDPSVQNFDTSKKPDTVEQVKAKQTFYVKEFKPRFSPIALAAANLALSDNKFLKSPLMKLVVAVGAFFEFVGRVKIGIVVALCIDLYRSCVQKQFSLKFSKGNVLAMYDAGRMLFNYFGSKIDSKDATTAGKDLVAKAKENPAVNAAFAYVQQMCAKHGTQ